MNVEHLIIIDGNGELLKWKFNWKEINPRIHVYLIEDISTEMFINARIGALYNKGFDLTKGDYLARIDDDNTIEKDHLETLYTTLKSGDYDAAYSWRYLWLRNSTPYLDEILPWHSFNDLERAKLLYKIWNEAGITSVGSNLYKDVLVTKSKGLTITTVDASEWLWRREVINRVRFTTENISYWQLLYGYSDDDMFSVEFMKAGFRAICTQRATLNYFLGGHSNNFPDGYQLKLK